MTGVLTVPSANSAGNYPACCNPGGDMISLLLNAGTERLQRRRPTPWVRRPLLRRSAFRWT
jgi:hypothetical protein